MAKGRVSATPAATVVAVTLLCLLAGSEYVDAATFTVGDSAGWSFNVVNWPNGKSFKAGDVLVFKYDPSAHNVAVVDQAAYTSCTAPLGAKVFTSGNDKITLSKGMNYFMCTRPGHCQQGMKIAVNAA